ncbi:MAG: ATP-dependent helicase [Candidatus Omnitrophica bacterium]|nr:ATP-dependent helicase [Candidatus Omnitrophota bacterium]MCM8810065.1 ATP-dependent helicase [Candidatus Omnitrophota bacterium]
MSLKVYPEILYEKELNERQLEIVKNAEGPCLVIAGAGSGKTRVLVYRVCYLIEKGISPSNILLLTFTNKAAKEMLSRVEKILKFFPKGLIGGTFHHVANLLLKIYGKEININPNFTIIDEEDSISIIKEIIEKTKKKEKFPHPSKIKEFISLSINTCESLKETINNFFPLYANLISDVEKVYKEYQRFKKNLNQLDYDDLLVYWLKLMRNEVIGDKISSRFRYILVDEYHDTNRLQSKILYLLSIKHKNIMVVGDDAQSIYSFRGATVANIIEFPKVYPEAKIFYLDINYRSTPQILNFANDVISHNKIQFPKNLLSIRENGVKPVIVKCRNMKEEGIFVSQRINKLIEIGIEPKEIGVLFRSRYQAGELEIELSKLKIPYIIRGGLRFFEQAHIKDIIAYYRVGENFKDVLSWRRIFNISEGIGEKGIERLTNLILSSGRLDEFKNKIDEIKLIKKGKESLEKQIEIVEKIKNLPFSEGIELILNSGYSRYINRKYKDDIERIEDIKSLKEIASFYSNVSDFLSEASLQEYSKGENPNIKNAVILSTIHQAKGLEWKIVFIIGVCDNHFPHPYSAKDPIALEEERRIFYVGITRAKEDLYITYYTYDNFRYTPLKKSIFIEEISPELYEEWDLTF